jgi:hypothetical protein
VYVRPQRAFESAGISALPAKERTANVAVATMAARRRPLSHRYGMKTPGTSLIAVAAPTSRPRGQRSGFWEQSKKHIAIKTMPTWPNPISSCTGVSASAIAQTTASARRGLAKRCTRGVVAAPTTNTSAAIEAMFHSA